MGLMSLGDCRPDPITGTQKSATVHHLEIVELGVRAEELGFAAIHIGEHHLCDYTLSSPPVVLGALAARTQHIRLGTGTTLIGILDPVRAAEDYATVDVVSNGRLQMVAGRGVLARTYPDFGKRFEDSRALYEENVELVLKLWSEEDVRWEGRFRPALDGVTLQPRPVQRPHPPLWVGGGFSEESIQFAARAGLPLMLPSVLQPPSAFAAQVDAYRESFRDRGHGGPQVGALSHVHTAKDLDEARKRWAPRHTDYVDWVGGELLPWALAPVLPSGAKLPVMPPSDFETAIGENGPAVCGSSQQVLDRIGGYRDALGLDFYLCHVDHGALPQDILFESIEQLAQDVMPHL